MRTTTPATISMTDFLLNVLLVSEYLLDQARRALLRASR